VTSAAAGEQAASAVALTLHVGPGPHRVGAPVPVAVRLANCGTAPVRMPCVLDGSETGTRRPLYRPTVLRGTEPVAGPPAAEDPLVGPLLPEDLRWLAPGESFDPTHRTAQGGGLPLSTFGTYRPDQPGVYRYTLLLDTTGSTDSWMGRFGQEPYRDRVLPLLAEVPRMVLTAAVDVVVQA
jgi:hypothetical protein